LEAEQKLRQSLQKAVSTKEDLRLKAEEVGRCKLAEL